MDAPLLESISSKKQIERKGRSTNNAHDLKLSVVGPH